MFTFGAVVTLVLADEVLVLVALAVAFGSGYWLGVRGGRGASSPKSPSFSSEQEFWVAESGKFIHCSEKCSSLNFAVKSRFRKVAFCDRCSAKAVKVG